MGVLYEGGDSRNIMGDKKQLKLFVWTNFSPDYKDGLAFAIAHDETEARKRIALDLGYTPMDWGEVEVHTLNRKVAYAVCGGG